MENETKCWICGRYVELVGNEQREGFEAYLIELKQYDYKRNPIICCVCEAIIGERALSIVVELMRDSINMEDIKKSIEEFSTQISGFEDFFSNVNHVKRINSPQDLKDDDKSE